MILREREMLLNFWNERMGVGPHLGKKSGVVLSNFLLNFLKSNSTQIPNQIIVTEEENECLSRVLTEDEIKEINLNMGILKAQDLMDATFFFLNLFIEHYWGIIQLKEVKVVHRFFLNQRMLNKSTTFQSIMVHFNLFCCIYLKIGKIGLD